MIMADREALIKLLHAAAADVSYYNAAEGNWSKETKARVAAQIDFANIRRRCAAEGIDVAAELAPGGYLL